MGEAKNELAAAIDVGSNSIRMKIVEMKGNGKLIELEDLRRTANLGRDSFSHGIIEFETVQNACDILSDYTRVMKDYKVKNYRAVGTSAFREAANRDYVLDQIRVRTGLEVEIINNSQERFLTYKAIWDKVEDFDKLRKEGTLIVDIGSGGVEVSLYKNGYLKFTENIKVGSLRLREILIDLERKTLNFPDIMEEFVESKIYMLKSIIKENKVKNFIGSGGELRVIAQLCGCEVDTVTRIKMSDLEELNDKLRTMTTQNIVHKFGVATERADILLPSVIIFRKFLELTTADYINAPLVSLRDGLAADIADDRLKLKRKKDYMEDIIQSARYLGKKYNYDEAHAKQVEKLALAIFSETKRLHGMGEREKFYIRMAAILHDIGKFVNLNQHGLNSYNIIMQSGLIGLSADDLNIIANTARYHSEENAAMNDEGYRELKYKNRIMVAKLSAILKLADTLDLSHRQSVRDVSISFDEDMILRVDTDKDIVLEQWSFENKAEFFQEVFGIRPVIKRKGR